MGQQEKEMETSKPNKLSISKQCVKTMKTIAKQKEC